MYTSKNCISRETSSLNPFEFLDIIKQIESSLGRPKERNKNQPRIIDIDILCYGNSYIETVELTIPHPQLMFRKFVLLPDKTNVVKHIIEKNA